MENKESFNYTYSAAQQQEIEKIRQKYLPKEIDKMEQLRRLDRSVYQKAQIWSLVLGIIGALTLGMGMSLAMSEFANILGTYKDHALLAGIIVGLIGMLLVALAYPTYNRILKKERNRILPEILRLTDELMQ